MCRISPRIDFAFKKLFGSSENQDLLLSLLNAILFEEPTITHIELKNPYNLADYQSGKMSILDIKAQDENGRWFNVEMQISQDLHFDKRAIYYWAKLITEQLTEGMMFKELKKTFSINILDFNFIPDTDTYHNRYKIINTATGKDDKLHDSFEMHYIELRKFNKSWQELSTALERWSAFLSRAHELDKNHLPDALQADPAIRKAVQAVDRMFDEEERKIYDVRIQDIMDVRSKIASALEEGLERGLEQGLERGLEQGRVEGHEKGQLEARQNMAKNLLAILDIETIAKTTGLTVEEVEQLQDRVS